MHKRSRRGVGIYMFHTPLTFWSCSDKQFPARLQPVGYDPGKSLLRRGRGEQSIPFNIREFINSARNSINIVPIALCPLTWNF